MAHNNNSEDNILDGSLINEDDPIFVRFRNRYLPASTISDATVMMSTRQIVEQIFEHTGTTYSLNQVYEWMRLNGYKDEALDSSMNFVWLMREEE